jgi:MFS family permease
VTLALRRSVASLSVPNYRRWFAGQVVSISGNWMQQVAEMWLVLQLTGSGAAVGITAAAQFVPLLLAGGLGGVLADRVSKRALLVVTQTLMAVPALILFALTELDAVSAWMVIGLILVRGTVLAIDNPARQSFVVELVGADRLVNAVGLNSVLVHTSRIAGPAAAALVIAVFGVGPCFLINALSFAAMIVALRGMDADALETPPVVARARGQLRSAVRYVWHDPALRTPLLMMAVIGTFSFNFQVLLPLMADFTWHGTAVAYAALTSAMALGSIAGALASGARQRLDARLIVLAALLMGVLSVAAAGAPELGLQLLILAPLGAASVTFAAGVNSTLQLAAEPAMRGRVMALYSLVFLGSTPLGGPLMGWLAGVSSPRVALAVGGVAAMATALAVLRPQLSHRLRTAHH